MKTISELNELWWYRLLKVVYLVSLLIVIGALVLIQYDEMRPYTKLDFVASKVRCLGGNFKSATYIDFMVSVGNVSDNLRYKSLDPADIAEFCDLPTQSEKYTPLSELGWEQVNENAKKVETWRLLTRKSIQYEESYETVGSWATLVLFTFLSIVIALFCFESLRRAFYYITLGSIKPPKKKHESDTILP